MFIQRMLVAISLSAACFAQTPSPAKAAYPTFQDMVQDAKSRIKEVTVEQLKSLAASGEKYTLIDVREDNEWAAGHASGAAHVGRGVLEARIGAVAPQKDGMFILYCLGGFRSALAADTLQKMGYTHVSSLVGGFMAYQKAGLPVEKQTARLIVFEYCHETTLACILD
jgi:rhodanese-related sulfurtransferase